MKTDRKDEKVQYDINRAVAKVSALLSGKIDGHEYLTSEEILLLGQNSILAQVRFNYSPFWKINLKTNKNNQRSSRKTSKVFQSLDLTNNLNELKQVEDISPQAAFQFLTIIFQASRNILKLSKVFCLL